MFLIIIIIRINDDKWINLKRKIILLNSKGNKNSSLLSPNDKGNKMYCSKNELRGISPIFKINKKVEINIKDPKKQREIFFILKLKEKWMADIVMAIKKICPAGACFVKKANPKIIGSKNQ